MKNPFERDIIFINLNLPELRTFQKLVTSMIPAGKDEERILVYLHEMIEKKIKSFESD